MEKDEEGEIVAVEEVEKIGRGIRESGGDRGSGGMKYGRGATERGRGCDRRRWSKRRLKR